VKGAAIESELTNCIDALWSDQGWIPLVSPRRLERTETESDFDFTIGENTEITIGDISSQNFGVALEASFDGRDNVFTPNSGQLLKLAVWRHDEAIGSDFDYWKGTFQGLIVSPGTSAFCAGTALGDSVCGWPAAVLCLSLGKVARHPGLALPG
jgi:hypothetical protein